MVWTLGTTSDAIAIAIASSLRRNRCKMLLVVFIVEDFIKKGIIVTIIQTLPWLNTHGWFFTRTAFPTPIIVVDIVVEIVVVVGFVVVINAFVIWVLTVIIVVIVVIIIVVVIIAAIDILAAGRIHVTTKLRRFHIKLHGRKSWNGTGDGG
jgi:hypothetical protein